MEGLVFIHTRQNHLLVTVYVSLSCQSNFCVSILGSGCHPSSLSQLGLFQSNILQYLFLFVFRYPHNGYLSPLFTDFFSLDRKHSLMV